MKACKLYLQAFSVVMILSTPVYPFGGIDDADDSGYNTASENLEPEDSNRDHEDPDNLERVDPVSPIDTNPANNNPTVPVNGGGDDAQVANATPLTTAFEVVRSSVVRLQPVPGEEAQAGLLANKVTSITDSITSIQDLIETGASRKELIVAVRKLFDEYNSLVIYARDGIIKKKSVKPIAKNIKIILDEISNYKKPIPKLNPTQKPTPTPESVPQQLTVVTEVMTESAESAQNSQVSLGNVLRDIPKGSDIVPLAAKIFDKVTSLNDLIQKIQDPTISLADKDSLVITLVDSDKALQPLYVELERELKKTSEKLVKNSDDELLTQKLEQLKEIKKIVDRFSKAMGSYTKSLPSAIHIDWQKRINQKIQDLTNVLIERTLSNGEVVVSQVIKSDQLLKAMDGLIRELKNISQQASTNSALNEDFQSLMSVIRVKVLPLCVKSLEHLSNLDMNTMNENQAAIIRMVDSIPDMITMFEQNGQSEDAEEIETIRGSVEMIKSYISFLKESDSLQNQITILKGMKNSLSLASSNSPIGRFWNNFKAGVVRLLGKQSSAQSVTDFTQASNKMTQFCSDKISIIMNSLPEGSLPTSDQILRLTAYNKILVAQDELINDLVIELQQTGRGQFAARHNLETAIEQTKATIASARKSISQETLVDWQEELRDQKKPFQGFSFLDQGTKFNEQLIDLATQSSIVSFAKSIGLVSADASDAFALKTFQKADPLQMLKDAQNLQFIQEGRAPSSVAEQIVRDLKTVMSYGWSTNPNMEIVAVLKDLASSDLAIQAKARGTITEKYIEYNKLDGIQNQIALLSNDLPTGNMNQ